MMKVSDPIIFGHVVRAFLPDVFAEHGETLAAAGLSPNDGLGGILAGIESLPEGPAIKAAIEQGIADGPALAMVDSDKGITNLHVPSDVIVDASMPAMIRTSGHMWGPDGQEADTLAVIPDSSYAGIYQVVLDDCRAHGAYDPATMGSVPNVGLMAQAAEEYGSHDKTFEIADDRHRARRRHERRRRARAGRVRRATSGGCARPRTSRSATGSSSPSPGPGRPATPAVFWLDADRAHDANLIAKVRDLPRRPRHRRAGPADPAAGRGDRVHPGADPQGRGHHLGHRQRAARLPHRPVPDPRARHVRQDALGRPADQRRRALRDRRRGLGAQARAAAGQGELPALGQPGRVPRPRGEPRALLRGHRQRPGEGARRRAGPGHRRPSSTRTSRRPAGSARSTTAARTSTSRSSGPRSSPSRPTTPSSPRTSRTWRSGCARTRAPSPRSWWRPGLARRHRRLLPARPRQGGRGDASVDDVQRGARLALTR